LVQTFKQRIGFFEEIRSRKGVIASDGKKKFADNGRLGDIDHGVKDGYFIDFFLETGFGLIRSFEPRKVDIFPKNGFKVAENFDRKQRVEINVKPAFEIKPPHEIRLGIKSVQLFIETDQSVEPLPDKRFVAPAAYNRYFVRAGNHVGYSHVIERRDPEKPACSRTAGMDKTSAIVQKYAVQISFMTAVNTRRCKQKPRKPAVVDIFYAEIHYINEFGERARGGNAAGAALRAADFRKRGV
jgi:hypothetical protein